jgi:hypothetical protein
MSLVKTGAGPSSNYLSEAEIMQWVEQQENDKYGQLRTSMDYENTRNAMLQELNVIEDIIKSGGGTPEELKKLQDATTQFLEKYGEVPEFAHMSEMVKGLQGEAEKRLEGYAAARVPTGQDGVGHTAVGRTLNASSASAHSQPELKSSTPLPGPFTDKQIQDWNGSLQKEADQISHNQDLAMIRVGELRNGIDDITKMASQMLKGANDAADLLINNLA